MNEQSLNDQPFNRKEAAGPLLAAVEDLCAESGKTLDDMEALTLGQISRLAQDVYGPRLPRFWQTWIDWQTEGPSQPMGDL